MLPFTDYDINQTADRDTAEERRIEKRAQEEEEFEAYEINKLRLEMKQKETQLRPYKGTAEHRNGPASL